jgi:hypothetical protein
VVSDGTGQYIDTGIPSDQIGKVRVRGKRGAKGTLVRHGSGKEVDSNALSINYTASTDYVGFTYKDKSSAISDFTATEYHDALVTVIDATSAKIEANGYIRTITGASGSINSGNFYVFARNAPPVDGYVDASYDLIQIWNLSDELVFDAIPLQDGQFYDKVSGNTFGTPVGTLVTKYSPARGGGLC